MGGRHVLERPRRGHFRITPLGTDLLLQADADTGYGNALNVYFVVKAFEKAGMAAIMIEDQVWPKRCGHMAGKSVIPAEEMVKMRDEVWQPTAEVAARELAAEHPALAIIIIGATIRHTANPTGLSAGYKENVIPGKAWASIDVRLAEVAFEEGPSEVERENVQRRIVVQSNVSGRDLRSVVCLTEGVNSKRPGASDRRRPEMVRTAPVRGIPIGGVVDTQQPFTGRPVPPAEADLGPGSEEVGQHHGHEHGRQLPPQHGEERRVPDHRRVLFHR